MKQMGGPKMPANPLADLAIPPEEMIHLPIKPDSNSGVLVWPMSESMTFVGEAFLFFVSTQIFPSCKKITGNGKVKHSR